MVRWIIILIILFLVYRFFRRYWGPKIAVKKKPPEQIQDEMVQDPVCGTYVPKRMALTISRPEGGPPYFCSTVCRDKYLAEGSKGKH